MIYWISGDSVATKYEVAIKLLDLLKTEKRNWRRSVFYINDKTNSNSSICIDDRINVLGDFIISESLDAVFSASNVELPLHWNSNDYVEIYIGKVKPVDTNVIYLTTYYSNSKFIFNSIVSELKNRDKI